MRGVDARSNAVLLKQIKCDRVASFFANLPPCLSAHGRFVAVRRRPWEAHFAALLRPDGNPVCDRGTQKLVHRPDLETVAGQNKWSGHPTRRAVSPACLPRLRHR